MCALKRILVFKHTFSRIMATQKDTSIKTVRQRLEKLSSIFKTEEKNGDVVPFFKKCLLHPDRIAITCPNTEYSYQQLYIGAKKLSLQISNICGSGASCNIGVFCQNDALLPLTQWGCWMSGQVFVPLLHELAYETLNFIIHDSNMKLIISGKGYEINAKKFAELFDIPLIIVDQNFIPEHKTSSIYLEKLILKAGNNVFIEGTLNNDFYSSSNALLVYNTNKFEKPKGCMITHKNLKSRIKITTEAWNYKPDDFILNLLPTSYSTYSVHSVMCLLNIGGKVGFYNNLDCHHIWSKMIGINLHKKDQPNILTALPSTYIKIIHEYNKIFSQNPRMADYIKSYCAKNFRLMVSGPLTLPMNIYHYWNNVTGHKLLRYYETPETGIVISNSYIEYKEQKSQQNSIGLPMPETDIRVVNPEGEIIFKYLGNNVKNAETQNILFNADPKPLIGELQVSGPIVFKGYVHQGDTEICFDNRFFKTGVIVEFKNGLFRLLGENYNDIVRSAGRSLSSDYIETLLQTYPKIKDVAVVGVQHTLWKQTIYALCVLKEGMTLDLENIQSFCSKWLPSYMCPDVFQIVSNINRNSVGKIDKKQIMKLHLLKY